MKHLEGKEVVLKPTGNNARYSKEPKTATVIKVAKVFMTIVLDGHRLETKIRFNGNVLSGECNSGYLLFESMEDYQENENSIKLTQKIRSSVSSYSLDALSKCTLNELKQINSILEEAEKR